MANLNIRLFSCLGSKTDKHWCCWGAAAVPEQKRNDKRRVEPVFWEYIHETGSAKSTVIGFHTVLVREVFVNTENVFHFTQSVTQSRTFASETQVPRVAYRFVCALEQPLHLNSTRCLPVFESDNKIIEYWDLHNCRKCHKMLNSCSKLEKWTLKNQSI